MGADGSNDNGRGRPDRPRSSPSGDTITPEEVERRCYNWAEVELEGSTWPDISWMDYCPCEEAFYAGTYIASCERTGTAPPSGAAPAPLPSRSGSPGASSSSTDNEAGIFMLVYASFAAVSFLALIGVTWWWKREGERRRQDEAIEAELANPWNVMARMRAGEAGGSRGETNRSNNGTKHSTQSTIKRGSVFGLFFENPTGSVVFGKELAVLDDPEAVAYVYGPGDDDDDAAGGKRVEDGDGSSSSASSSTSSSTSPSTSSSTSARTFGEVRVTMLDDEDAPGVRTYDGADTRRHGSSLAGARLAAAADSDTFEMRVDGSSSSSSFASSSSSVDGSSSSGGSREASRRGTRMVNPDFYLPNSRQNSRGRQNGGRLRSSQMWGDCDTDTDEEDAPSRG